MQIKTPWLSRAVMLTVLGLLAVNPVFADKPAGTGGGNKHEKHAQRGSDKHPERDHQRGRERGDDHQRENSGHKERHFDERHRTVVHEYYVTEHRAGRCPPGLAKKNNGCRPPGQAKKWRKGRPLPREVIFYELPPRLVLQLGEPPAGHRFVRVASDILLIAIGTGIVIDAIDDLNRM